MGSSSYYYYNKYNYIGCEKNGESYKPHFLDSCSLCRRPLNQNTDIFMYRGATPFCSQECRQEQIDMDEADDKRLRLSSPNSLIRHHQNKDQSDANKAVRTGTLAAVA